jgi:hypothetical protein
MQNRNILRLIYRLRHEYMTWNNGVLVLAAIIAVSWSWASVQAVQRNYALQREVDGKQRQQRLFELQTENLQFEQRYYKSNEYLTLEAKRRLGLAEAGERVLILPPNSAAAKAADLADQSAGDNAVSELPPPPPLTQWMDFLFGAKPSN